METYNFTLIVEGSDFQSDELADGLYEAGCDDALAGVSDGVQYLDFDREATSLDQAILSAVKAVESVEGLTVIRLADAGLISMAHIAVRVERSRESVRLLVAGKRGPGGFPAPVTDPRSRYRLWRVEEVDRWFQSNFIGTVSDTHHDLVRAAFNAVLELRRTQALLANTQSSTSLKSSLASL